MNGILDSVLATAKAFRPQSVMEYTALQLAKKLDDTERVRRYAALIDHTEMPQIVGALIRAQGRVVTGKELIAAFDDELTALTTKDNAL
jgi:hypothetical protein